MAEVAITARALGFEGLQAALAGSEKAVAGLTQATQSAQPVLKSYGADLRNLSMTLAGVASAASMVARGNPALQESFAKVAIAVSAGSLALQTLRQVMAGLPLIIAAVRTELLAMLGPVGLVVAGVTLLATLFLDAQQKAEILRTALAALAGPLGVLAMRFIEARQAAADQATMLAAATASAWRFTPAAQAAAFAAKEHALSHAEIYSASELSRRGIEQLTKSAGTARKAIEELTEEIDPGLVATLRWFGKAWEGAASEAERAAGWMGRSTAAMAEQVKAVLAEVARSASEAAAAMRQALLPALQQLVDPSTWAALSAEVQQFIANMVPGLIRAGQALEGVASESARARGWMGELTGVGAEVAAVAERQAAAWLQNEIALAAVGREVLQVQGAWDAASETVEMHRILIDALVLTYGLSLPEAFRIAAEAGGSFAKAIEIIQKQAAPTENVWRSAIRSITNALVRGGTDLRSIWDSVIQNLADKWTDMLDRMIFQAQSFTDAAVRVFGGLQNTWISLGLLVANMFKKGKGAAKKAASELEQIATSLAQSIGNAFAAALDPAKFQTALEAWIAFTEDMKTIIMQKIREGIIAALVQTALFKEALAPIMQLIGEIFNRVKEGGTGTLDDLTGLIDELLNNFAGNIEKLRPVFDVLFDLMRRISEILNSIMGGGAPSVPAPKPPGAPTPTPTPAPAPAPFEPVPMQAGGIVLRPTLALVGERGPELVMPLDRAREVAQRLPPLGKPSPSLPPAVSPAVVGEFPSVSPLLNRPPEVYVWRDTNGQYWIRDPFTGEWRPATPYEVNTYPAGPFDIQPPSPTAPVPITPPPPPYGPVPWSPTGLQAGGIVTKPTLAVIGERGPEAVIPLGAGAGANVTVNLGGVLMLGDEADARRLAMVVARKLKDILGW